MILHTLVSLVQPWVVAFSPNSFCYRGSYFKSRDGWSRNFRVCCGGRVKNLGCHWWLWLEGDCGRWGCCWYYLIVSGWDVSWRVLLLVFDRGFGWEVLCWEVAWRVSVGCELGCCCWWCVNGMWLGGIARDVVGGVLWLAFFLCCHGFCTSAAEFFANSIRLWKKTQFHALQKLAKPTVYGLLCQF